MPVIGQRLPEVTETPKEGIIKDSIINHDSHYGFGRLMFVWKASLYKLLLRDLLIFLFCFGLLSVLYRFGLNSAQQTDFQRLVLYFNGFLNMIPLSFVLGFFLSSVFSRWWTQWLTLPSYDRYLRLRLMLSINMYIPGITPEIRLTRRTLLRYANLMYILLLRQISTSVRKRFPTMEDLMTRGYMTREELDYLQAGKPDYWIPSTWFVNLLGKAHRTKLIKEPRGVTMIIQEFNKVRDKCSIIWSYDWMNMPLVYTQAVTIVTYSFFLAALLGRQRVGDETVKNDAPVDVVIPVSTVLQFLFYMGLLKVAEHLLNPYGEDENDFELNMLIDKNNRESYLGTETLCGAALPVEDIIPDDIPLQRGEKQRLHLRTKRTPRRSFDIRKMHTFTMEDYLTYKTKY